MENSVGEAAYVWRPMSESQMWAGWCLIHVIPWVQEQVRKGMGPPETRCWSCCTNRGVSGPRTRVDFVAGCCCCRRPEWFSVGYVRSWHVFPRKCAAPVGTRYCGSQRRTINRILQCSGLHNWKPNCGLVNWLRAAVILLPSAQWWKGFGWCCRLWNWLATRR